MDKKELKKTGQSLTMVTGPYLYPVKRGDIGFSFSVCPGSCLGYISESTLWKVFKFHIRIEHQWKVCNVVFSFDLMKNCENDRILKTYENLGNSRPLVQAVSPKVCIGVLLSIRIRIKHILKVCNVMFWIKSMKNCQIYRLL